MYFLCLQKVTFNNCLNGLENVGLNFEQFIFCQCDGQISRRRKSSVLFSQVLEKYEPEEIESPIPENENQEVRSYLFSSSPRMSIFSRMSEASFQSLGAKYQCILIICCLLMAFLIGVAVGAITVTTFLCSNSSVYQVKERKNEIFFQTKYISGSS